MILNHYILSGINEKIGEMEEEFQLMLLASEIVDCCFNFFEIERKTSKVGRPHFEIKNMIKLIFYGYINKITSSVVLAHNAKYNFLYSFISHGCEPSDRTIRDYRKNFMSIFQLIMSFTLIATYKLGLSDFKYIAIDGTIKQAYNSPFNIIKEKDIRLLIKHYMVEELTKNEIKKLRKTAKKFLKDKTKTDEEKVDILFEWWRLLDFSGQSSLGLNDHDARWMKIKDKGQIYPKFSYNLQLGTDTESKLICGVNVVQNPTDHYQIPALMNQIISNLNLKPTKISADTIYLTLANLNYLDNLGITALIPTSQQNRENSGEKPNNRFAIGYFVFDEYKNVFICPEGQELTLDGIYQAHPEKGGGNKLKAVYSNFNACNNCINKGVCFKTGHRSITRYVHELAYKTERIISSEKGIEEYKLRSSTVESHNGTFKRVYLYDFIPITGLKRVQGLMFAIVASYNLIRFLNLIKENNMSLQSVINSIRYISSS
ncbi:transposase [Methanobrevibacter ruminantium M1]|uniref:Transposase n=1 Tax=Methanobrevibacter ruminantium (strain ATCC 35063 / DSM 1093 / JCM 13430 / OCM 146 / M1) TaxID=634498 RepID=D3DZ66_METRM|nr:transposase [Methanobrevibacter ruminantium]ADC47616.1 transposase [Methanobrevibacter ruminantium M1]